MTCPLRPRSRFAPVRGPASVAEPPYGLPSAPHPGRYRLSSALRHPPLHSVTPADTPARLGSGSTDGAAPSLHPPHLAHFPVRRGDGEGGRGSIHPPPQWWQDQKTSTLFPIAEPGVEADGRAPRLSTGAGRNVPSRCLTGRYAAGWLSAASCVQLCCAEAGTTRKKNKSASVLHSLPCVSCLWWFLSWSCRVVLSRRAAKSAA